MTDCNRTINYSQNYHHYPEGIRNSASNSNMYLMNHIYKPQNARGKEQQYQCQSQKQPNQSSDYLMKSSELLPSQSIKFPAYSLGPNFTYVHDNSIGKDIFFLKKKIL